MNAKTKIIIVNRNVSIRMVGFIASAATVSEGTGIIRISVTRKCEFFLKAGNFEFYEVYEFMYQKQSDCHLAIFCIDCTTYVCCDLVRNAEIELSAQFRLQTVHWKI